MKTLIRKTLSILTFGMVSWSSKRTLMRRQLRAQRKSNRIAKRAA